MGSAAEEMSQYQSHSRTPMKLSFILIALVALHCNLLGAQDLNSLLREAQKLQKVLEKEAKQKAEREKKAEAQRVKSQTQADVSKATPTPEALGTTNSQSNLSGERKDVTEVPMADSPQVVAQTVTVASIDSIQVQRYAFDGANIFVDIQGSYAPGDRPSWNLKNFGMTARQRMAKSSNVTDALPFRFTFSPDSGRSAVLLENVTGVSDDCVAHIGTSKENIVLTAVPLSFPLTNFRNVGRYASGCDAPKKPNLRWSGTLTLSATPTGDVQMGIQLSAFDLNGVPHNWNVQNQLFKNLLSPAQSVATKAERVARDPDGEKDPAVALTEARALMQRKYGQTKEPSGKRFAFASLPDRGSTMDGRQDRSAMMDALWILLTNAKPLQEDSPVWKQRNAVKAAQICIYGNCENGYGVSVGKAKRYASTVQYEGYFLDGKHHGIGVVTGIGVGPTADEYKSGEQVGIRMSREGSVILISSNQTFPVGFPVGTQQQSHGLALGDVLKHQQRNMSQMVRSDCFAPARRDTSRYVTEKVPIERFDRLGNAMTTGYVSRQVLQESSVPGLKNVCNLPVYVPLILQGDGHPPGVEKFFDESMWVLPGQTIAEAPFVAKYDPSSNTKQYMGQFTAGKALRVSKE
jgi:hypothetical protein